MTTRDEQIVELRRGGATLNEIAEQFELSSERVRQIAQQAFVRRCACCGAVFETTKSRQIYCGSCHCVTCGNPVPQNRMKPGSPYCQAQCVPGYVFAGAKEGSRFRRVETGIYVKRYNATGVEPPGHYCFDQNRQTFVRFDDLEQAQAFRASGAWSRRAASGNPGAEAA